MLQIETVVAFVASVPLMVLLIRSHPKCLRFHGGKVAIKIDW